MDELQGQTVVTVERAADILNAFTDADGATLGVTEVAQQLKLSKAVVHRILSSLRSKGFVDLDLDSRRYSLGPAALALGLTYLQQIDIRDQARATLRELAEKSEETATLSIRRGYQRMYVDQVTPDREVKMTVQLGHPYPLHAGASSKCFLAHLPEEERERYLASDLRAMTPITVISPAKLRRELSRIRKVGYGSSFGERQHGAGSVAAPVYDHEGNVTAVVSVCGPVERFRGEVEAIAPLVVEATGELSRKLGYQPG